MNSAEVAVGLAYSSLLFAEPALAAEVGHARDPLGRGAAGQELEYTVLRAAPEARNPDNLRGLLRLGDGLGEAIFDAARSG